MAKKSNPDIDFSSFFKDLDKMNPEATMLSENALSVVNDWIDTGSLALNAICSGSLFNGIPMGRITGFSGPSGCGKTLIMMKIMANAQKKGMIPVIWDSEAAADRVVAENLGCDVNSIKYCPVETVEDCRNQMVTFLDKVIADPTLHGKFIIGLDSLGNLASSKEIEDARAGKTASDMGLRAKVIKSMMRTLTYKCARANVPMVFSNHTYADPSSMFPSLVKNQSGGSGPLYLASLLVQMSVRQEKGEKDDEDLLPNANKVSGVTLSAMTVKNRFIPPFLKTELYLSFLKGLSKYTGLKDLAVGFGVIEQSGSTYSFKGEKIGYASKWENDVDFWEQKCIPELEKTIKSKLKYSDEKTIQPPDDE
jgi:recombination protein RecA